MKRWYVVQVYTGLEDIVKADLEKKIQEEGLGDLFGQILVPTSEISYLFAVDMKKKREKIFPGYLLINMEMTAESFRLVSSNARVTRFLGGEIPMALTDREVEHVFSQIEGKVAVADEKSMFVVGTEVHVVKGPFSGVVGAIERIDEEKERLTLMVSIFGRLTPVEFTFDQIKK